MDGAGLWPGTRPQARMPGTNRSRRLASSQGSLAKEPLSPGHVEVGKVEGWG